MWTELIKKTTVGLGVTLIAGATLLGPAAAADHHSRDRHNYHHAHADRGYVRHGFVRGRVPDAYAQSPDVVRRNMDPYGNRCIEDLGYGRYGYCDW
jgi:hypothetical protein